MKPRSGWHIVSEYFLALVLIDAASPIQRVLHDLYACHHGSAGPFS